MNIKIKKKERNIAFENIDFKGGLSFFVSLRKVAMLELNNCCDKLRLAGKSHRTQIIE